MQRPGDIRHSGTCPIAICLIEDIRVPAYVIATINVTIPQEYEEYRRLAGIATVKFGGKFLARGDETALLEGALAANRGGIVEYAGLDTARRLHDFPEYRAARAARENAAAFTMVAVSA